MEIEQIAHFTSPFKSKFGIPRQSGIVDELEGKIVFERKFRNIDAIRGLEGFDYLWLIWGFSANRHKQASPVVRPPLLGGNERTGVFATRSPYRPNAIGLSSVRIKRIDCGTPAGPVIHVAGADLMDGTPIYDIKPYIEYSDSHPGARCGFVSENEWKKLEVHVPDEIKALLPTEELPALIHALELDPRPHYHNDPQRIYGMPFGDLDIHFRVDGNVLTVIKY